MGRSGREKKASAGTPHCPRCGYDQRGPVAGWIDACPLVGTCTECGLEFRWAEVMLPEKFEPRWCVEFSPRWRIIGAAAKTFIRSSWPWGFWTRLMMSQRVRWRRLAIYLVFLLGPLLLAYVIAQGSAAMYARWWYGQQIQDYRSQLPMQLQWAQTMRDEMAASERDARQYGGKEQALQSIDRQIRMIQAQIATPATIDHSYAEAALEAIVFPFGSSSWGSVGGGVVARGPYLPPVQIWSVVTEMMAQSGRQFRFSLDVVFEAAVWLGLGLALILVFPLTLVLLPVSRRRAKVRWRHIARVTVYGMAIPVMIILAGAVVTGTWLLVGRGPWEWFSLTLARFGPVLMLVCWWAAAVGRYLKIPHGLAVAVLHAMLASLLVSGVAWLVADEVIAAWIWL
ncbi:MAG: hypothetical protein ACYTGG_08520 [Planctomycetota bacterium]